MTAPAMTRCVVCREPHATPEGWFHLTENRWLDRLKILRFQDSLATSPGIYNVCCGAHVRELVVHWMTTGRLDFLFARVPFSPRQLLTRPRPQPDRDSEAPTPASAVLGELAVHRESLTRLLRTNPYALSAVLEALIQAIEPENQTTTSVTSANPPSVEIEEPAAV